MQSFQARLIWARAIVATESAVMSAQQTRTGRMRPPSIGAWRMLRGSPEPPAAASAAIEAMPLDITPDRIGHQVPARVSTPHPLPHKTRRNIDRGIADPHDSFRAPRPGERGWPAGPRPPCDGEPGERQNGIRLVPAAEVVEAVRPDHEVEIAIVVRGKLPECRERERWPVAIQLHGGHGERRVAARGEARH